jgi:hypothetical protein
MFSWDYNTTIKREKNICKNSPLFYGFLFYVLAKIYPLLCGGNRTKGITRAMAILALPMGTQKIVFQQDTVDDKIRACEEYFACPDGPFRQVRINDDFQIMGNERATVSAIAGNGAAQVVL